ncbi:MAG: hypothetical protein EHM23_23245 [Acidobacteria bacterium]|nr:MAG: hypothetical protein EHM23_23245 [Acidobacteriota bacterium]
MHPYNTPKKRIGNQRGAALVMFALLLIVMLGFVALAIDLSHLFVVTNELQNAADAGALAAARVLYTPDGTAINTGANQVGHDAAEANRSEKVAVEVNWTGGNSGDVERGHWSFATRTFTPNDSLAPFNLWDHTTAELDLDVNFINAVRVKTRRDQTPAASYFAGVLGFDEFKLTRDAVAYIGFAGTLAPEEVDQPIAICKESILNEAGEYNCNIGRMINSGNKPGTSNTGGWTNFSQPCETASVPTVDPLVCGTGNPEAITYGQGMGAVGGMQDVVFQHLEACANLATTMTPWKLTLPVVECPGNNVSNCPRIVGAVTLWIVWIQRDNDPHYNQVPWRMGGWSSTTVDGQARWGEFVDYFKLKNVDGTPAPWDAKSIYFLPDCNPHGPAGRSGGENFGILAKIPVLVE